MRAAVMVFFASSVVGFASGCAPDVQPTTDAGHADGGARCMRDADCDDGLYCNGVERCASGTSDAGANGCVAGTRPCMAGQTCDEAVDLCRADCVDADGDGATSAACGGSDCDDADPHRFPTNVEICDALDQDCDPTTVGYRDLDRDGLVADVCCNPTAAGGTTCGPDCDDTSALVGGGDTEVCDMRDNDCDTVVDEMSGVVGWYADGDGDGFGDPASVPISSCEIVAGRVPNDRDCDDTRARRSPGAPEVCDGIDNDCDAMVDEGAMPLPWYIDFDGDGFGDPSDVPIASCMPVPGRSLAPSDCDDEDASRNPAQAEVCDARDNDCDTSVDEGVPVLHFYADLDADGFGNASDSISACRGDATHTSIYPGDCDDTMVLVNPRGIELCNGLDDDCNRIVDGSCFADVASMPIVYYSDAPPHVADCGAGEVLIGVRYATGTWCDLGGCVSPFVNGLSGICARVLLSGSPAPPVSYTYSTYAEQGVGDPSPTTELRCPAGSVVAGLGVGGGLRIACQPLGYVPPTTLSFGAATNVDWSTPPAAVLCPAGAAVTGFDFSLDPFMFGVTGLRLRSCAALSLSESIP